MINDTIAKIEKKITQATTIDNAKKQELLKLVADLKHETGRVSESDHEAAQSVVNFADATTHEALREFSDPRMFSLARDGLSQSVRSFEASHPELVSVVNTLSTVLANMGI